MKLTLFCVYVSFALAVAGVPCNGQSFDPSKYIAATVQLDSVVIVASQSGLNVDDFIDLVLDDASLYDAFHNLRTAGYIFQTTMAFEDRRGRLSATYDAVHRQYYDGRCRRVDTLYQLATGDFFKGRKQKYRYYTYTLYDRLFLTHGIQCTGATAVSSVDASGDGSSIEKHVDELKTLMFRPGHRSHVPLIGRKTEIFSQEMAVLYDYSISVDTVNRIPAYVFTAQVNDAFADRENKMVFKELTTWFSREDFQVIRRSYQMSQSTLAYMFDVRIDVSLMRSAGRYFPTSITYAGEWNIPTRRKEHGTFQIAFSEFQ